MEIFVLVMMLVPALMGLIIAVVLVLLLTRSRAAAPPPLFVPGPRGPEPAASTWNVQVLGSSLIGQLGGSLDSTFGTLTLRAGRIAFTPDDAVVPAWDVACPEVWVRRQGVGPFAVAALVLHGPMGEVRCNVSRERINRFSANSLKDFREVGYATQFVAAAQAHGARVA
ncbi:hypothetical protein [Nocardioides marmotae]|uniref:Uncharacterized protein n=1 Tax=Nocardioides marmotae TaxID=2663857 RepID=A0A6I3JFF2_9ACTN|nr:hypothetical protein [Nocardioides marmotae]MCR6033349.1 hypothetical protein [Gordonia jinghuaiqii]MBC9734106.1 hypothetical protein [Nocardioides marmotae]MTB85209.1 hypothetical protein [Nocardioides marmotae]MTB97006.1 hypothetical protein [Nocardioides marmotae]QKE00616.1 hypothetical protein HPC71_05615 [Nocardioides marmotae]